LLAAGELKRIGMMAMVLASAVVVSCGAGSGTADGDDVDSGRGGDAGVQVDGPAQVDSGDGASARDGMDSASPDGVDCLSPKRFYRDLDGDGFGDDRVLLTTCDLPPDGFVTTGGDCDDLDGLRHPGAAGDPGFVTDRCGMGDLLEPMTAPDGWVPYLSANDGSGAVAMTAEGGGCLGGGVAMSYDLPAPTDCGGSPCAWTVMRKVLPSPVDLSGKDYVLFPFRGAATDPIASIDFKLEDLAGCRLIWQIKNATDLAARRAAVVPLKFFSTPAPGKPCTLDLRGVAAIEIGIVQPAAGGTFSDETGTLHLDAITSVRADDIRMTPTFFDCAAPVEAVQERVAADLLARQRRSIADSGHAFVATWFEETPSHYYVYSEALLLMTFTLEAERTGKPEYRAAATSVADQLVGLQRQVTSGIGRWYDLYWDDPSAGLRPEPSDLSWAGNTAWVVIALDLYRDLLEPTSSAPYDESIRLAGDWLEGQIDAFALAGGTSGAITSGTEGNISTFFALVAADRFARAASLRDVLLATAWKADESRFWMGVDYPGLAIDVIGNWGADFLRAVGEPEKALAGLGLAGGVFPARSFDDAVVGLGDIAGPWQPAVEFIGQYVAAGGPGAAYLLQQAMALEMNGTFPGSPADFGGGDGWNTKWRGVPPAAWIALSHGPSVLGRLSLPTAAADFESADDGFGTFEERVQPNPDCYGTGIGRVGASADFAASGQSSLRVSANDAGTTKSDHLIANRRIASDGQTGTWRMELDALIPSDVASSGQSGPEWSMQNTGEPSPGAFITRTAGIQYRPNPQDPEPDSWAVWAETSSGVAGWKTFTTGKLAADTWYHFTLVASYDTNRYVSLTIRGGGVDRTFDLSAHRIASESKLGFNSRGFWVSLEAENQWTCGAPAATQYRVYYDNVVVRR
jgi:hypothetical protein